MAWVWLVLAGIAETAWVICLAKSEGFRRAEWTVGFILTLTVSMGLLAIALRTLPVGTAYAVWVGIGAVGAAIFGVVAMAEPLTAPRLVFLALLIASIVGLKLTAS